MKKRKKYQGFTLVEMLVVLLIIGVLVLLFVPNLSAQKKSIDEKGNAAIVKVVETQIELYRLDHDGVEPTETDLIEGKYVTDKQYKIYEQRTP